MGPVATRMQSKLTDALAPIELTIEDDSQRHVGHAGHDGRGESHFNVTVVSDEFEGRSRVDRQRLVYRILSEELADRVHALSVRALTSAEAAHKSP